jgi:hypothetical protein
LHLARVAYRGGDGTDRSAADGGIRLAELRVVEQIEALGAELNGHALDRAEVLEERSIEVGASRTEEYVASGIAVHELGRRGEGGLIEPVVNVLTTVVSD